MGPCEQQGEVTPLRIDPKHPAFIDTFQHVEKMFKELGWEVEEEKVPYPPAAEETFLAEPPLELGSFCLSRKALGPPTRLARRADSARMHSAWWEKPPANS